MADESRGTGSGTGSRKHRRTVWVAGLAALLLVAGGAYLAQARSGPSLEDLPPEARDSALAVREAHAACRREKGQEKVDCYSAALSGRLRSAGVGAAMATLQGLYELDRDVEREAHVYAHHIGIEAYQLGPGVAETFAECTDMYSSGCYHGVIQAYFEDRGRVDAESVNGLCEPYKGGGQSRWVLFQCLHGMGHGLMMVFDYHLPRSLEACDLLEDGWDRQSCYGGAFMENVMHATAPHHPASVLAERGRGSAAADEADRGAHAHGAEGEAGAGQAGAVEAGVAEAGVGEAGAGQAGSEWRALDPDDPLHPCTAVDERYWASCYLMQTSAILHLNGGDVEAAAATCEEAPFTMRPTCFQSLGRDITARTLQDPRRTIRECAHAPEEYLHDCYVGAVKALVDWRSAPEPGLEFCRMVEGEREKRRCYRALGEEIGVLVAGLDERAALCDRGEAEYRDVCKAGARIPRVKPAESAP